MLFALVLTDAGTCFRQSVAFHFHYLFQLFAYYPMMFDKNPANVRSKTSVIVEGFEELNMDLPGTFFGGLFTESS